MKSRHVTFTAWGAVIGIAVAVVYGMLHASGLLPIAEYNSRLTLLFNATPGISVKGGSVFNVLPTLMTLGGIIGAGVGYCFSILFRVMRSGSK